MMNIFFWISFVSLTAIMIYNKWFRDVEEQSILAVPAQTEWTNPSSIVSDIVLDERHTETTQRLSNRDVRKVEFFTINPEIIAVPSSLSETESLELFPVNNAKTNTDFVIDLDYVA